MLLEVDAIALVDRLRDYPADALTALAEMDEFDNDKLLREIAKSDCGGENYRRMLFAWLQRLVAAMSEH